MLSVAAKAPFWESKSSADFKNTPFSTIPPVIRTRPSRSRVEVWSALLACILSVRIIRPDSTDLEDAFLVEITAISATQASTATYVRIMPTSCGKLPSIAPKSRMRKRHDAAAEWVHRPRRMHVRSSRTAEAEEPLDA